MRIIPALLACSLAVCIMFNAEATSVSGAEKVSSSLNFTMKNIDGKDVKLSDYQGKVLLLVNVASECGLTPQYEKLQALHEEYAKKGLVIIGFPCNQFGRQEPGGPEEIKQFCTENYGVTFPLMSKVDVNGENACDLYLHLTLLKLPPKGPGNVSWNFEKFVIARSGEPVSRFEPRTSPDDEELIKVIKAELAK